MSFPLAFLAGFVSFLSPCVLPVVPSYVAYVSGLTLEDLADAPAREVRRTALLHSALFVAGFSLVFMTLGLVATAAGTAIAHALPWIHRAGGVVVLVLGLHLVGVPIVPALVREHRVHLRSRPVGALGSLGVGVAFGAGWTPCIGPVLGSILLYAGLEATMARGTLLLGAYAAGLGVPFLAAAGGLNWFLAGSRAARRWTLPLQRTAGAFLLVVGALMITGRLATLTAFLASLGQLVNLEVS